MSTIRKETVENYSKRNSGHYDDPTNKNFLYGKKYFGGKWGIY